MQARPDHDLFRSLPEETCVTVGGVPMPTPYLVFDGHGSLVCGTGDIDAAHQILADQDAYAVTTRSGRAVACLFLCNFTAANHGPHIEVQLSLLVSPVPDQVIDDRPEACLAAIALNPEWSFFCAGLWNDAPGVVAFNRDHLGLPAQVCHGTVARNPNDLEVSVRSSDGGRLVQAQLAWPDRTELRAGWSVARCLGLRGLWVAARNRVLMAHVMNPKGPVLSGNQRARTLTAPDHVVITRFHPDRDTLTLSEESFGQLRFKAGVTEHLSPFRFVYHHPDGS